MAKQKRTKNSKNPAEKGPVDVRKTRSKNKNFDKTHTDVLKSICQNVVPFVEGFVPPAPRHAKRAIGDSPLEIEFEPDESFQPVPKPVKDTDWLACQIERGQSYAQFLATSPWLGKRKNLRRSSTLMFNPKGANLSEKYPGGKIYLLPLKTPQNNYKELHADLDFEAIREYTESFYGIQVEVLKPIESELRENTVVALAGLTEKEHIYLTTRFEPDMGNYQVRMDTAFCELDKLVPSDSLFVIVITMLDLYCDTSDLFVAGIGNVSNKLAIFSCLRYDPALKFSETFWFERKIYPDVMPLLQRETLLLQRSCKLIVHEIGHILGISHCIYYECVMNGSGNLDEDYRQPHHLCPVDLRKIVTLCGVNVIERYNKLQRFYMKHEMYKESAWVMDRIQTINKKQELVSAEP